MQNEQFVEERIPFTVEPIPPFMFDLLMQDGWRALGGGFIRHSQTVWQGVKTQTIPLRIRLEGFRLSKSQRKVLRLNRDCQVRLGPIRLTEAVYGLFERHRVRFSDNPPDSLNAFLRPNSDRIPVPGHQFWVHLGDNLIATSFLHVGNVSVSGTYAMFDPLWSARSLGIFTLLAELDFALKNKKQFYYLGYAYDVPSQMDYKKNFHNLEAMDWQSGTWRAFERQTD